MIERQKILIVDDREENLYALEKILRETGADVFKANSGDEALAATLHNDFALAILDVHMPGMSGFELADHLRSDEKTLSLPIIFLTATFIDEETVFKGYEAGAVDYIIKPYNPVVLNGKVEAFLELARHRRQLEDMVGERTRRLQQVNQILLKVRNINQLIVHEEDERRLIREACRLLVDARGFHGAWMAVVDASGNVLDIAHDGFSQDLTFFTDCLRAGALPPCCKEARHRGVAVVRNEKATCAECALKSEVGGIGAMIAAMEHEGVIRGFIGLAVAPAMIDEEELSLFQEVAGDIAYALHNVQVRKERQAASEALRRAHDEINERHKELKCLYTISHVADRRDINLEEILQVTVDSIPAGWQYTEATCAKIALDGEEFRTENFGEIASKQSADIVVGDRIVGSVEVGYLEGMPEMDEGPFLREERNLIDAIAAAVGRTVERTEAEKALRESETRYRLLADNTLDVIWQMGLDLRFTYVNPAVTMLTGYTVDEWIGTRLPDHCDEENFAKMAQVVSEEMAKGPEGSGTIFEAVMLKKNKEPIHLEIHGKVLFRDDGRPVALQGVTRDITDRKKAAAALRESEQRYRAVFNIASIGIDLVDRQGRFVEVNRALSEFLGYTREELRRLTISEVTHPDDVSRSVELHEAVVRGETSAYRLEKRYVRKDGTIRWGDTAVSAILDAAGNYRATVGVIQDITEQKKSEEARLLLEAAVEQTGETIEITDSQGAIVYVNPSFERTTGFSRGEALGNKPCMLKSGRHDDKFYGNLWRTITNGDVWRGHFINRKKDGSLFEEEATVSPVKDRSGNIVNYVAVKRDVTNEISLQKQLFQAQKMESIGTLAGGIAHDFNNLLTVMQGYSEIMLADKTEGDPGYVDLSTINQAAKRGADLVRRILTFSRQVESSFRPVSLNEEVRHAEKLLLRTIPKMIGIELRLAEDLSVINADAGQIEQSILNLAINARDAMPDGGRLVLETKTLTLDADYCRRHLDASPGEYVLLAVSDTGQGMDEETAERVFEPFFTTKKLGEGTGLGLAMVFGIVKVHGGHVTCESKLGVGTTFKLYFPVAVETGANGHVNESRQMPALGTETILVVDDEDGIRELGKRILTHSGYTVLAARNGKEALEIYGKEASAIDLVVLDLIMPEMGGAQCLERLLEINPEVKVLVASGFAVQSPTKDLLEHRAKGFVKKPFQMKDLLGAVRRILDGT